jgi:hypothetical protein
MNESIVSFKFKVSILIPERYGERNMDTESQSLYSICVIYVLNLILSLKNSEQKAMNIDVAYTPNKRRLKTHLHLSCCFCSISFYVRYCHAGMFTVLKH